MDNTNIKYRAKSSYMGNNALQYDKKRRKRKKWKRELAAVERMVAAFDLNDSILDLPLGTGRFLQLYRKGNHRVFGIDISMEMLREARSKIVMDEGEKSKTTLAIGEAEHIPFADNSIDYVVCIRLLNWLPPHVMKEVLEEFRRVARKGIILGVRTLSPMGFQDFIRLAAVDIVPTPRHIMQWIKALNRFAGKVRGKIKKISRDFIQKKTVNTVENIFSGSSSYDKNEMLRLFSQMEMEIIEEIPIDVLTSYSKKKIRPYSICFLTLKK